VLVGPPLACQIRMVRRLYFSRLMKDNSNTLVRMHDCNLMSIEHWPLKSDGNRFGLAWWLSTSVAFQPVKLSKLEVYFIVCRWPTFSVETLTVLPGRSISSAERVPFNIFLVNPVVFRASAAFFQLFDLRFPSIKTPVQFSLTVPCTLNKWGVRVAACQVSK
jgi:hypothetical protein